jgi:hypothetical protein
MAHTLFPQLLQLAEGRSALKKFVDIATTRDFTSEEFASLQNLNMTLPEIFRKELSHVAVEFDPKYRSRALPQDQASVLLDKVAEYAANKDLVRSTIASSYFFLGNVIGGPWAMFLAAFPILLLGFYILNVFHSRETHVVLSHPVFPLMMLQLLSLIAVPIILAAAIENALGYFQAVIIDSGIYMDVDDEFPVKIPPWFPGRFYLSSVMASVLERPDRFSEVGYYFISYGMVIITTFISWVACGLWVARRFGGGVFLACSTLAILTAALIILGMSGYKPPTDTLIFGPKGDSFVLSLGSRDKEVSVLWEIPTLAFVLMFVIGLLVNRFRLYLLLSGYIGVIIGSCGLITSMIAVNKHYLLHFCLLMGIILGALGLIETSMRRSMFNFLNDPQ